MMNGLYMTQSRPYLAEASNTTNETHFGTPVPVQFGQNNLLVSHGQQRNVHDTTNMSVVGQNSCYGQPQVVVPVYNPYYIVDQPQAPVIMPQQLQIPSPSLVNQMFPAYYPMMNQPPHASGPGLQQSHSCTCCLQQNAMQLSNPFQCTAAPSMYKQITADGVDFTFGSPSNYLPAQQQNPFVAMPQQTEFLRTQFDQLNLQQQIALKQLEKHSLETLLLQEQLKRNPFLLQFHHDKNTSTDDLFNANDQRSISKALPDLQAAAAQCLVHDDIDVLKQNVRQLHLKNSPDLQYSSNPQTNPRPFATHTTKSYTCNSTLSSNNENATPKVTFDAQQSTVDMDAPQGQDDILNQVENATSVSEYSVEKVGCYKTKKEKNENQHSNTSVKYSVEQPNADYKYSSDDRSYSTKTKDSNCSDSEEDVAYKRMGGKFFSRKSKRKNAKKQSKKKYN